MIGDYAFALNGFRISLQRPNYIAIAAWEDCLTVKRFLWKLTYNDKIKLNYDSVFSAKKKERKQIKQSQLSCQKTPINT